MAVQGPLRTQEPTQDHAESQPEVFMGPENVRNAIEKIRIAKVLRDAGGLYQIGLRDGKVVLDSYEFMEGPFDIVFAGHRATLNGSTIILSKRQTIEKIEDGGMKGWACIRTQDKPRGNETVYFSIFSRGRGSDSNGVFRYVNTMTEQPEDDKHYISPSAWCAKNTLLRNYNSLQEASTAIYTVLRLLGLNLTTKYDATNPMVEINDALKKALKLLLFVEWLGKCNADDETREKEETRIEASMKVLHTVSLCQEELVIDVLMTEITALKALARDKIVRLAV